jgi:hypothetical protein
MPDPDLVTRLPAPQRTRALARRRGAVGFCLAACLAACNGTLGATPDGGTPADVRAGGDDGGTTVPDGAAPLDARTDAGVAVAITPRTRNVAPRETFAFMATVTGATDTGVAWTVRETGGGTISAAGLYTAPATNGTYHLVATSRADPSRSDTAVVDVSPPDATGVWRNVTPREIHLERTYDPADNYGVQDVVVDPARPNELYAFVCYQGVWRSTDFGRTWAKVSTGRNGAALDTGRPWTAAIDPNRARDPSTPPTLYTVNGYGAMLGVFRSTDGGVNWTRLELPNTAGDLSDLDVYSLDIDPYDSAHVIAAFHGTSRVIESTNGGTTWTARPAVAGAGDSLYVFFVDTGDAATTRGTWLAQGQWAGGTNGLWRTTNGGGAWTRVNSLEHLHGNAQIFQAGGGVVYAGGVDGSEGSGTYRSTDYGAHWSRVVASGTSVVGTPNFVYSFAAWATLDAFDPQFMRAPRAPGTAFAAMAAPAAMTNGPKRAAVTFDGAHYVIVSGNWAAGLWRYVEP